MEFLLLVGREGIRWLPRTTLISTIPEISSNLHPVRPWSLTSAIRLMPMTRLIKIRVFMQLPNISMIAKQYPFVDFGQVAESKPPI